MTIKIPPPCLFILELLKKAKLRTRFNSYIFTIIIITLCFSSSYSQVKIKEIMELNKEDFSINFNKQRNIPPEYNIKLQFEWEKTENNYVNIVMIEPDRYDTLMVGGTDGFLSFNLKGNKIYERYRFQVRNSLLYGEKNNLTCKIFFNGELQRNFIIRMTGDDYNIPYKNYEFYPPLAADFSLNRLNFDNECLNKIGRIYVTRKYDKSKPIWRTDYPMTFEIIDSTNQIVFAKSETNEIIGQKLKTTFYNLYQYILYLNINEPTIVNTKFNVKATANNGYQKIITDSIKTIIKGEINGYNYIYRNEKLAISSYLENTFCKEIIAIPQNVKLKAKIIKGDSLGVLVNPVTNEEGKEIKELTTKNNIADFIFYANNKNPNKDEEVVIKISSNNNALAPFYLSLHVIPSDLIVDMIPKILTPGDTANLIIKHINFFGDIEDFPKEQKFKAELIEGNEYGTILSPNGEDTSDYFESIKGGMKFIANENINTDKANIRVKITTFGEGGIMTSNKKENISPDETENNPDLIKLVGIGSALIKNDIALEVLQPTNQTIDKFISSVPEMPKIIVKAHLKNYHDGKFKFGWEYIISWLNKKEPQLIKKSFRGEVKGIDSLISTWTIPWDSSFIGGDTDTLIITANIGSKTFKEVLVNPFRIIGKNPTIAEVKKELSLFEQVIVYNESYPKWKHFNYSGFPIFGPPHGYGLMQLDNPRPTINQIWNWKENIKAAKKLLKRKYSYAINYVKRIQKKYKNVPDLTEEQLLQDVFRRYNGGHDWKWDKNLNKWKLILYWRKDKNGNFIIKNGKRILNRYSQKAIEVYKNIKKNNHPKGWD